MSDDGGCGTPNFHVITVALLSKSIGDSLLDEISDSVEGALLLLLRVAHLVHPVPQHGSGVCCVTSLSNFAY